MDAAVIWTAVGALGTIAAAGVAAWAARQSRNSAAQANAAAGTLATIERDRRHDELAPDFELKFTETSGGHANLLVTLAGGRLESLDEVTYTILDETGKDHWGGGLPDGVTQEDAEAFVWGPWEFNKAASVQVVSNRESRPRAYSRVSGKNWDLLPLSRTRPGHWMSSLSQGRWQEDHAEQPIRLLITCRREGYEPWTLLDEVVAGQVEPEERKQAEQVDVSLSSIDSGQAQVLSSLNRAPVHMVVVTNSSKRPVRKVTVKIEACTEDMSTRHKELAHGWGTLRTVSRTLRGKFEQGQVFTLVERSSTMPMLRAGETVAFVWAFPSAEYPRITFKVRFTDDAGLDWEIDNHLHLVKVISRDW